MRVVAGSLRGRRLRAPEGAETRPTSDRVREATFNALSSLDVVRDATVLDLFAGSGALGIEALSRGARHVTFVEQARPALRVLRANLAELGIEPRTTVVPMDVLRFLHRTRPDPARPGRRSADLAPVDLPLSELVLADPPYGFAAWAELLESLSGLLEAVSGSLLVVETGAELGDDVVDDTWERVRTKRYGRTVVTFLERRPPPERRP